LLWFVGFPIAGTRFIVRTGEQVADVLARMVEPHAPSMAGQLREVFGDPQLDSLDWVELLIEIETALPQLSD
jgi:hypothetical protein